MGRCRSHEYSTGGFDSCSDAAFNSAPFKRCHWIGEHCKGGPRSLYGNIPTHCAIPLAPPSPPSPPSPSPSSPACGFGGLFGERPDKCDCHLEMCTPSPPLPPPPPLSGETVVLTITASGDVSDYADTSGLRQKIATAAGVDASLVTISVTAASVIITATIAVPATTTVAAVQSTVSSNLGTAAVASAALGITVEAVPTITSAVTDSTSLAPPPPTSSDDGGLPMGAIIGIAAGGGSVLLLAVVVGICCRINGKKRAILAVNPDT